MDEQNISMEELKVDEDENLKEISMEEDILGAQSLLMSEDSEDEDAGESKKTNKSPLKKISPKASKPIAGKYDAVSDIDHALKTHSKKIIPKRSQRIADSDDDELTSNNKDQNVLEEVEDGKDGRSRKKKISALIDSDSEDEVVDKPEPTRNSNRLMLVDSDSENEQQSVMEETRTNLSKVQVHENSDSEEQPKPKKKIKKSDKKTKKSKDNEENSNAEHSNIRKKTKKTKRTLQESEDEDSEDQKRTNKKVSDLVDSESEDDESRNSGNDSESELHASAKAANFEENNNEGEESMQKGKNKTKVIRASAKKAMDEMQAIQSEQQRLHREASISIPYHKPKKHTLQDFLNRRSIIKPPSDSTVTEAVRPKNLKMNQEELEEYAKLMDERAKEATEFFKSESEEEEEEEEELEFKDNPGILDNRAVDENKDGAENVPNDTDSPKHTEIDVDSDMQTTKNVLEEEKENLDGLQLTEEELAEILAEEEQQHQAVKFHENPTCSKVLITEVIELPKLDMNTVRISPIKKLAQATPRASLTIKQLLATKNLTGSPSLSGDPNKLIDLETGDLVERKPSGVENLMKRLMSNVKARKSKTNESCNILSTENGKLEMTKVNVSLTEEKDPNKEPKPRAAYFELKRNLKEIIKNKRLQELHKKQEEEIEHNKCLNEDGDDEEDDGMDEEEYEPDSKPNKKAIIEIDDEENALAGEDEEEEGEGENDEDENENEEDETVGVDDDEDVQEGEEDENENGDDGDDNEEDDDSEPEDDNTNRTKRSRIIKTFDDSDEEGDKDDIDFLKTQPPVTQPPIFDTQTSSKSAEDDENELMALCSGTFDATQQILPCNALMSQIPRTQNQGKTLGDEELMELCSGTFDEVVETKTINDVEDNGPKCNKIVSSDEEVKDINETKQRTKKLTKTLKKKTAKLSFSDDDEDEEEQKEESDVLEIEDEQEVLDEPDEPDEEPGTFVDYDSEENEIVVKMTKKECVKQAANFFENEAELSESEWGSADEDEKNLDKYDIELGDEDEFDKEKIRSELEQIHTRKMLDEDMREVRKIQEMLFEDEEKDGVGRQRQFKWKNAESGFCLDDGPRDDNGDGNNGDSGDELNEHQWRKIRFEREQFLKDQGLKPDSQDMSTTLPNTTMLQTNHNTTIAPLTAKKLQIITAKKTSVSTGDPKKATPFLISKGIAAMNKKSVRGSFLVRDRETLNKLAGLTKGGTSISTNVTDMGDSAGTVSIKSAKAKNFVFATLTEEEHETNKKRKADDLLNSSNENGTNFMKKPKIEPRRDKCFIDQLL